MHCNRNLIVLTSSNSKILPVTYKFDSYKVFISTRVLIYVYSNLSWVSLHPCPLFLISKISYSSSSGSFQLSEPLTPLSRNFFASQWSPVWKPEITAWNRFDSVVHRCEIIRQKNKIVHVIRALVISRIWKKKKEKVREKKEKEKLKRGEMIITCERNKKRRERTSGRNLIASSSIILGL